MNVSNPLTDSIEDRFDVVRYCKSHVVTDALEKMGLTRVRVLGGTGGYEHVRTKIRNILCRTRYSSGRRLCRDTASIVVDFILPSIGALATIRNWPPLFVGTRDSNSHDAIITGHEYRFQTFAREFKWRYLYLEFQNNSGDTRIQLSEIVRALIKPNDLVCVIDRKGGPVIRDEWYIGIGGGTFGQDWPAPIGTLLQSNLTCRLHSIGMWIGEARAGFKLPFKNSTLQNIYAYGFEAESGPDSSGQTLKKYKMGFIQSRGHTNLYEFTNQSAAHIFV